jgi:dTMP kinase
MAGKRGAFILIEGLDRCGKSTQTKMLAEYLNQSGRKAELIGFPDRSTATGKLIDGHLTRASRVGDVHALHLLFSSNRWERKAQIETALSTGNSIVCDRYSYSGVAYSAAQGLDVQWCWQPERGLPAPDLVIFLELSAEAAKQRGGYGDEIYEKVEFQRKVAVAFGEMRTPAWKIIDAGRDLESVFADVKQAAEDALAACAETPIQHMQ